MGPRISRNETHADHAQEQQLSGDKRRYTMRLPVVLPDEWRPQLEVPETRSECPPRSGSSPCPAINCRYNLVRVDGCDRPGRRGDRRTLPKATLRWYGGSACVLDLVEAEPSGLPSSEIAKRLGTSQRRVQQILKSIATKLRKVCSVELEDPLPPR